MRLQLPDQSHELIATRELKLVQRGLLNSIHVPGLQVWTGPSRIGKTTAAEDFVEQVAADFDPGDPLGARALHVPIIESTRRGKKPLLLRILRAANRPASGRLAKSSGEDGLLARVVDVLKNERILVLFLDEADALSDQGIRAISDLHDATHRERWGLKTVLIGMDNLPERVRYQPRLAGRCEAWVYFKGISKAEIATFVEEKLPRLAAELASEELTELVAQLVHHTGGRPGEIMKFVRRMEASGLASRSPSLKVALATLHKVEKAEEECFARDAVQARRGI